MPGVSRVGAGQRCPTPRRMSSMLPPPEPLLLSLRGSRVLPGAGGPSKCWGQRERPIETLRTPTRLSQGGGPPSRQHEEGKGGGRVCVRVPSTASAGVERGCPTAGPHAEGRFRQPLAPPHLLSSGSSRGGLAPRSGTALPRDSPKELPVSDGDSGTPGGAPGTQRGSYKSTSPTPPPPQAAQPGAPRRAFS